MPEARLHFKEFQPIFRRKLNVEGERGEDEGSGVKVCWWIVDAEEKLPSTLSHITARREVP